MANRTIVRLYDAHDTAVAVVQELEQSGIPNDDISIVASNRDDRHPSGVTDTSSDLPRADTGQRAGTGTGAGASAGAVIGGGAGLLAGLGMLAIPGVGPVVAAGWLVATLAGAGVGAAAGAAAGGLVGSLTGAGVPEDEAHVYAESVRRGSSLVTVRADEADAARIEGIMNRSAFVDPAQRRAEYESHGWSRFDETAPAYSSAEMAAERARRGNWRALVGRHAGQSSWHSGDPGIRPGSRHKCKWRLSVAVRWYASKPARYGGGACDRSGHWLQYKRRQSERQRQSLARVDAKAGRP